MTLRKDPITEALDALAAIEELRKEAEQKFIESQQQAKSLRDASK